MEPLVLRALRLENPIFSRSSITTLLRFSCGGAKNGTRDDAEADVAEEEEKEDDDEDEEEDEDDADEEEEDDEAAAEEAPAAAEPAAAEEGYVFMKELNVTRLCRGKALLVKKELSSLGSFCSSFGGGAAL